MKTVENQAYKPPGYYSTLAHSSYYKDDIIRPNHLNDTPRIAKELGFTRVADFPTKKSQWQVFERPEHDVPNFPDGSTRISSSLAVYGTKEELTHAILRTSEEPYESYQPEEFTKDLAAFTKHYVERPRLLGFPSQELARQWNAFASLAVGAVSLSVVDYYTIQSIPGSLFNGGSLFGGMAGPVVHGLLYVLAEKHAKRQISHLDQYVAGERVLWTLEGERYHNIKVIAQRELYQALLKEGADLSPNQFLEKIYGQIPEALIEQRYAEIKQAQYPELDSPRETGNSFPKLVEVSHVLQLVESHLQLTDQLKQSLAQ